MEKTFGFPTCPLKVSFVDLGVDLRGSPIQHSAWVNSQCISLRSTKKVFVNGINVKLNCDSKIRVTGRIISTSHPEPIGTTECGRDRLSSYRIATDYTYPAIQPSPHRIICLLIPSALWKKAEASSRYKHRMFRSRAVEIEVMGYFPRQSLALMMTVGVNICDLNGRFCKRQNIQSYLSINYIVIGRRVFTKRDRSTMPIAGPPKNRQGRKAQRNHQLQANLLRNMAPQDEPPKTQRVERSATVDLLLPNSKYHIQKSPWMKLY